jgi:predicted Zn finger-like uncharacterized protein
MAAEQYTRCPACRTIFRVTPEQLALRGGQVRCGHCRTVFDGVEQRISLAPVARHDSAPDDLANGPPTVTLRDARALEPAPMPAAPVESHATHPAVPDAASTPPPPEATRSGVDFENRFAWDQPRRKSGRSTTYAIAMALLALLLVLQVLHHFRDGIAARWPSMRPALTAICGVMKCEIRPLRDIGFLSIEASSLESDPAHRGLLILTATVRNRAPYGVAYPHIELTLTDAQERVVVRRAIAPAEYMSAASDAAGIPGNGEIAVKLFLDASATTQSGYRVYLFYP